MDRTCTAANYGADAPGNYQKFFVPGIGGPIAEDLVPLAGLKAGERVLDVACGTGVVARMAARHVLPGGAVTGVDLNPGMLATARANTPAELEIDWIEADAATLPLDAASVDVVFCQMGLQFIPNKLGALREMCRVLAPSGRVLINVPGPKPPLFAAMGDGIASHLTPDGAAFVDLVFAMHDATELRDLLESAGFRDVSVTAAPKVLWLPPPETFLWQYIHSTQLASAATNADTSTREALQEVVCPQWTDHVVDGRTRLEVRMTTVRARA